MSAEPGAYLTGDQLMQRGWPAKTLVWRMGIDGGQRGKAWKQYRFDLLGTRVASAMGDQIALHDADTNTDATFCPIAARVMYAGTDAFLQPEWNRKTTIELPRGMEAVERIVPRIGGPTGAAVDSLTPEQMKCLWTGYRFFIAALKHSGGPPPGERVWPITVFDPLLRETYKALTTELHRPATQPEVRAAMAETSGRELSPRTFIRRVNGRWEELTRGAEILAS